MFSLLQNHATGMPVLDAEADFRRARRAHAVARIGRWLGRRSECRHPRALGETAVLMGGLPRTQIVPLDAIVGTLEPTPHFDAQLPAGVGGPAGALAADRAGPPARRRTPADRAGQAARRLLRARRAPPRLGGARARSSGHRRPGDRRPARSATRRRSASARPPTRPHPDRAASARAASPARAGRAPRIGSSSVAIHTRKLYDQPLRVVTMQASSPSGSTSA